MRLILFIAIFLFNAQFAFSQKLQVELDNIRSREGQIVLSYYTNPEQWLDQDFTDNEFMISKEAMIGDKLIITFDSIPPGNYGIALSDDESGDDEMDYNFFGLPKEGYGFSNNVKVRWSKPKFRECMFRLVNDTTIFITVQYR